MRRWLVAGAASAGVGAALWGMALTGPQIGIASAEDGAASSSVSAGASGSDGGGAADTDSSGAADKAADSDSKADSQTVADTSSGSDTDSAADADSSDADSDTDTDASDTEVAADVDSEDATVEDADTTGTHHAAAHVELAAAVVEDAAADDAGTSVAEDDTATPAAAAVSVDTDTSAAQAKSVDTEDDATPASATVETGSPQSVVVSVDAPNDQRQIVANLISGLFSLGNGFISILPDPLKSWVSDSWFGVRRTLFNQAPWASPVQVSGQTGGPISGNLGAIDLEGDTITYRVTQGPTAGSVVINADGTYTYTPGAGFNGVDSFVIAVSDSGAHINLLDPFRSASTSVSLLVNKSAVRFVFNYVSGANLWSQEAKNALQNAADTVAAYFIVTTPVVVTYDVTGESSPGSGTLAETLSSLISSTPGVYPTVVQNKLLTGVDSNGATADGQIDWNFAYPWAFGDLVSAGSYDFTSVAMHELLHSFGFTSYVISPNTTGARAFTIYDSLLVSSGGVAIINGDYTLNSAVKSSLTGAGGGVYFQTGDGSLIKVYTPSTWSAGSSLSHLDPGTYGSNQILMTPSFTTGRSTHTLSDVELKIMADLGYTLASPTPSSAAAVIGFVFLIRRRKEKSADEE